MTTRTGDVRRVHATLAPIAIALCSCAGGCVTASLPHVGVPLAGSSEAGATVGAMGGIAGVGNTSASLPAGAFAGAFIVSKPAPFFELSAAAGGGALASSLSANHWLVECGGGIHDTARFDPSDAASP